MKQEYMTPLIGKGTKTSDSIPARYSKGEVVIPAHVVDAMKQRYGDDVFSKMMAMAGDKQGANTSMKDGVLHAAGGFDPELLNNVRDYAAWPAKFLQPAVSDIAGYFGDNSTQDNNAVKIGNKTPSITQQPSQINKPKAFDLGGGNSIATQKPLSNASLQTMKDAAAIKRPQAAPTLGMQPEVNLPALTQPQTYQPVDYSADIADAEYALNEPYNKVGDRAGVLYKQRMQNAQAMLNAATGRQQSANQYAAEQNKIGVDKYGSDLAAQAQLGAEGLRNNTALSAAKLQSDAQIAKAESDKAKLGMNKYKTVTDPNTGESTILPVSGAAAEKYFADQTKQQDQKRLVTNAQAILKDMAASPELRAKAKRYLEQFGLNQGN